MLLNFGGLILHRHLVWKQSWYIMICHCHCCYWQVLLNFNRTPELTQHKTPSGKIGYYVWKLGNSPKTELLPVAKVARFLVHFDGTWYVIKLHKVNNRHTLSADCVDVNPVVDVAPFELLTLFFPSQRAVRAVSGCILYMVTPRKPYVILKTVMDSRRFDGARKVKEKDLSEKGTMSFHYKQINGCSILKDTHAL